MGDHKPDPHVVVRPEDVTDEALLPRQFRFLAGEVRELLGVIRKQVVPTIARIGERMDAMERDATELRRRIDDHDDRLAQIERALALVP